MDGFEKRLFSSKSTAGPRSTGFVENNENDSSQDKLNPKFQNYRKNVMSPTISAASKAVGSPRKKILGERKQNLGVCDAQGHKMFNLSPQNNVSSHHLGSESEDDNLYDPLKNNYLSPRPKYLRFNPNRRREIVERLGWEVTDELISSTEMEHSCFSPPKISVESADEDEEEEEEEDEIEEKGWCPRGVFTLIACLLSISYICSMNSLTPSTTQQAIWNVKDGYLMIHRQALEFVNAGVFKVDVGGFETVEDLERPENDDHGSAEIEFTQAAGLEQEDNLNNTEASESGIIEGGGLEESETLNFARLMDAEIDESGSVLVMDVEGPNQLQEIELSMSSKVEGEVDTGFHDEMEPSSVVEETPKHEELVPSHETFIGYGSEVVVEEGELVIGFDDEMESKSVVEETPKLEELVPSHEGYGSHDEVVEMEKKERWNTSIAVIGTLVAFLFSTLLAFIYHSKKAKETKSILKPHKFAAEEKVVDRKVEFLARPSSPPPPPHPNEEFSHRIYAPSVELIGEIVVGSHRSCRKYKTTEFEESNATPIKQQSFTTSSTSYGGGSFTNEGGGQVGEAVTPVRRSSRLRNRAATITSPY